MNKPSFPVIVLDRDGVINQDSAEYIKSPDEWHALPGSLDAIARLHQAGFAVVVATNQSGVARGLFSTETLTAIHQKMAEQVTAAGGQLTRIFWCPHGPDEGCDCRKPRPGLLLQAAEFLACGLDNMIVVGDAQRDLDAATAVGARPILVRSGKGRNTEKALSPDAAVEVFDNLAAVTDTLILEVKD